jgi:hypothetical protein
MNARDDMSDTDVLSAVRDSLSGVPLAGPPDVKAIMARGRARRHRRVIPGVTGTLALAAGAALAVTTLATAGQPANHDAASEQASHEASQQAGRQPTVQLAAWTVAKLADGNISVTIRELKDPAGLQSTLRADGVPASVTFASQLNSACQTYRGEGALQKRVFPEPYGNLPLPKRLPRKMRPAGSLGRPPARQSLSSNHTVVVIDPSALPGNAGVQLAVNYAGTAFLLPQVVDASSQCTGG